VRLGRGNGPLTSPDEAGRRGSLRGVVPTVVLLALLAACAKDAPQDYLNPAGPMAAKTDHLFKSILYFAVVPVFVVVEGLLLFSVIRYRHRAGRGDPVETDAPTKLRWVVVPAVIMMFVDLLPFGEEAKTTFELASEPKGDVLPVEVYGHMWWWEFVYPAFRVPKAPPSYRITTANELHIPTGRPVRLTLRSIEPGLKSLADFRSVGEGLPTGVIHSFWVPKLGGKQDVVPGRDNKVTLVADKPGVYKGQCAEYCNLSHANMRLRVVAQAPDDFEAWIATQKRSAAKPESGPAAEGYQLFTGKGGCLACHTALGIEGNQGARVGPNLTHLKSRETFAGAIFENTAANLKRWVKDPPAMKPMRPKEGTGMPNRGLTQEEVDKVVAFLETLR
jgi:cytochrome c oxidase subunit II